MFSVESIASVQRFIAGFIAYLITAGLVGGFQAWVSKKMGEDTLEKLGYLTINPFAHVDMIGVACLLLIGVGFKPPMPINPYHMPYRHRTLRYAIALFSGFFMAIVLAVVWPLLLGVLRTTSTSGEPIASFFSFQIDSLLSAIVLVGYMLFITSIFFAILYLVYDSFVLLAYCISDKITDEERTMVNILFIILPMAVLFFYGDYLNKIILTVVIKLMKLF